MFTLPGIEPSDFNFRFRYLDGGVDRLFESQAASVSFAPGWLAARDSRKGNDLAVVRLKETAPKQVDRYEIYTGADEVGRIGRIFGYGKSGTGLKGETIDDGKLRGGRNVYESRGDFLNLFPFVEAGPLSANLLIYDFDDCTDAHDAYGLYLGRPNTICLINEVNTGFGDSGGPTFLDGKIAGIHTAGFRFRDLIPGKNSDVDDKVNATFGELAADTRVASRADWIASRIPEPGTWGMAMLACAAPLVLRRLRRQNTR
jgi:hypothetical protein